jgi:hypothetical protein
MAVTDGMRWHPCAAAIVRGGVIGALAGVLVGTLVAIVMAFVTMTYESASPPVSTQPFMHHGEWVAIVVGTIAGAILGSLAFGLVATMRSRQEG